MILQIDFQSGQPLYQQLRDQVVLAIADGRLSPGEHLPTIRALAEESGINMMTVSKAYQLLKQEGYIATDRRSGAVVLERKKETAVSPESIRRLRLCISELQLAGMDEETLLSLCRDIYEEGVK